MTDFEAIPIKELIPQRPPFVMIDAMTHCDELVTCTRIQIGADNIFVEGNELTEAGVMENIAQTCAARMGYINKFLKSDKIKLGVIGAVKNLVIYEPPKLGDLLITTIEVESELFAITLVKAKVETDKKLIALCEMKIALTNIDIQETI